MGMKLGSLWLCSYLLGKLFERLGRASPGSLGLVDVKLAVARRAFLFLQGATWGSVISTCAQVSSGLEL